MFSRSSSFVKKLLFFFWPSWNILNHWKFHHWVGADHFGCVNSHNQDLLRWHLAPLKAVIAAQPWQQEKLFSLKRSRRLAEKGMAGPGITSCQKSWGGCEWVEVGWLCEVRMSISCLSIYRHDILFLYSKRVTSFLRVVHSVSVCCLREWSFERKNLPGLAV